MLHDESYWAAVVSRVMPLTEILITGYCFYRLAKPFMENKKTAFYAGAAYSLTMTAAYFIPVLLDHFIFFGTGIFAAFLVMSLTERKNHEQKAFIAVTFFSLRGFTSTMAELLYDKLYDFAAKTDYMTAHPDMWFPLYVGVCILYLTLEFLFTSLGIRCILKNYVYKHDGMTKKELLLLTVPSLMGAAGYETLYYYRRFYIAETGKMPDIYDTLSFLYYTAAVITITVIVILYQNIKAGQKETLQNELLAAQIDSIRQHIEQVESLYQNIRSVRHDMTNHIITLERLYAGNKAEEAKAYGTELKAALTEGTDKMNSGNPVTDVILQEMKRKAENRNIRFDIDFHYPADSHVNAFDISVILNNALQNALEHTGKSETPYISIRSYRRKNAYMIEINNSFTGTLQWDAESGLPVTSKQKSDEHDYGQSHGYGLINIRRVAEKYAGDIAIDLQNGMFCLSILLMTE